MSMNEPVDFKWGVKIALRDGVQLSGNLYLPADLDKPSPVICALTPYISQGYHERGVYFASRGYPFIAVDVRGRGNSEGEFVPNLNEGRDGHDVVEWIAKQAYCDGQVAMCGGSYGGLDQWNTARELPPHLATIVPVASPFIGVDFPLRNNVASPYWMQWLTLVAGRASQEKIFADQSFWNRKLSQWAQAGVPFSQLDTYLGSPSPIFQEWLAHPHQEAYWDRFNPTAEHYARLSIPILTITGSYDADQLGALMHYTQSMQHASTKARQLHYLVIGPWDHAGTAGPKAEFGGLTVGQASLIDIKKLHLDWYTWVMRGGPTPELLQKRVAYYVMGAEEWRYADSLQEITAHSLPLYLGSDGNPGDVYHSGQLSRRARAGASPDHYQYDPRDTTLTELESTIDPESLTDQRLILASCGKHLVYHTEPFDQDTEVSGFFRLAAWLAIDCPDTDFIATVYEIGIDGRSLLLTSDWIRARYREGLREERLIGTREPLRYDFSRFPFISRRIKKSNRLRLVIGPLTSIYAQRNYNSGGIVADETVKDARTVTVRLYHDETHPSALYLPIGKEP
jgi:uncharacterized protein